MPVAELMERISASEFVHWMAFAAMEPFGAEIEDYRAGLAPSVYINAHAGKESGPPLSPMDLYPHYRPEQAKPAAPTPEETAAQIKARIFGVVDDDGKGEA